MEPEHVDVLIFGAGLSGIGAGVHLQRSAPRKTFAILEARESIGGTWDLFRYPGIRSDSDMYTLGYSFRPWDSDDSIAPGPAILDYVRETASENGVDKKIRFNHRVTRASWSTRDALWTVEAQRTDSDETVQMTCNFILGATGYYRYDEGYTPDFAGVERFEGEVVHPQHWPQELDYADKRVVVIGSGATAVTLVPAMAKDAAHVTMLQRSPSYIVSLPGQDPVAKRLRRLLPSKLTYSVVRWKNVMLAIGTFQLSRRRPALVKSVIRKGVERQLPTGYDVDRHFKPRYNPWDQRVCLVPGGDLFRAIRKGSASVVTDEIDTFTERGLQLTSGAKIDADVIVTATGLNLLIFGGMQLVVDGEEINPADTVAYKGMMLSDVPNMAFVLGYTNASWTLKADLCCEFVCRLLNEMDSRKLRQVTPVRDAGADGAEPFLDFSSGYVLRALDGLPKQGAKTPWKLHQNYLRDLLLFRRGELDDGVLTFSNAEALRAAPEPVAS